MKLITFAQAIEHQNKRQENHREEQGSAIVEYERDVVSTYAFKYPRRRKKDLDTIKKQDGELVTTVLSKWQSKADDLMRQQKIESDRLKKILRFLGCRLKIEPSKTTWTLYDTVYGSTYHTQGFGAMRYAMGTAEAKADHVRHYGFEVRITETNKYSGSYGIVYADLEVWVNADSITVKALKLKPGPSLRETVRMCWKRGVNPRVYNPFLPQGYEEREGLDYFGGEVADRRAVSA